jgi:hypothetical protein
VRKCQRRRSAQRPVADEVRAEPERQASGYFAAIGHRDLDSDRGNLGSDAVRQLYIGTSAADQKSGSFGTGQRNCRDAASERHTSGTE